MKCSECAQGFADKPNEARCRCSCHSHLPLMARKPEAVARTLDADGEYVPRWQERAHALMDNLEARGLLEFGG